MNARTKRIASTSTAVAAVALIIGGAWGVSAAVSAPAVEPEPTVSTVVHERPASEFTDVRPDVTPTPEPVVEEAPPTDVVTTDPAPVVEPAPAAPAPAPAPVQPAPAPAPAAPEPAPAPPVVEGTIGGGDQQAGECREYNDANECTAWYVP